MGGWVGALGRVGSRIDTINPTDSVAIGLGWAGSRLGLR